MEQNTKSRFSSPLSLQNICRINLLFRLEEFSVQQLLLLPLFIRRDLSKSLSLVDLLHYEAAGLFHDIDTTRAVGLAHRYLVRMILGSRSYCSQIFDSTIMFALAPDEQLESQPCSIFDRITESFSSLPIKATKHSWSISHIPNRYNLLFSLNLDSREYDPNIESLKPLLQYCHFLKAPKEVEINVSNFLCSRTWPNFRGYLTRCDDPVSPFLQSFLSQVETIDLGINKHVKSLMPSKPDSYSLERAALYVIMCNIITNPQPCFKHLKIHGYIWEMVHLLFSFAKPFFCSDFSSSLRLTPYFLKGLSVLHDDLGSGCKEPYDTRSYDREAAGNVSVMMREFVVFQMKSLEHVSVHFGKSFCYESTDDIKTPGYAERNYGIQEYRELLSRLTELLKQPQLRSLSVGRAYLTEAYQLIEAFLCTEANHNQSLTIEGVEEESKWIMNEMDFSDSDSFDSHESYQQWRKDESDEENNGEEQDPANFPAPTHPLHSPLAQPLPDSNGAMKCLGIGRSCDRLHAWLFSIPNLQLKELKTSRPDLVPSSGVTFTVIDTSVKTVA